MQERDLNRRIVSGLVGFGGLIVLGCSASPRRVPPPVESRQFSLEQATAWIETSLCGDPRCPDWHPEGFHLHQFRLVEISDCVMRLERVDGRNPATIPFVDVWEVDLHALAIDVATIAIRWRADPERDAWYREDRDGRSQNADWTAETGSAILVLGLSGPWAAQDAEGLVEILRRVVALCKNQTSSPEPTPLLQEPRGLAS